MANGKRETYHNFQDFEEFNEVAFAHLTSHICRLPSRLQCGAKFFNAHCKQQNAKTDEHQNLGQELK